MTVGFLHIYKEIRVDPPAKAAAIIYTPCDRAVSRSPYIAVIIILGIGSNWFYSQVSFCIFCIVETVGPALTECIGDSRANSVIEFQPAKRFKCNIQVSVKVIISRNSPVVIQFKPGVIIIVVE